MTEDRNVFSRVPWVQSLLSSEMFETTYKRSTGKMATFWVLAPCGLVEVYGRFRAIIALMV
jgi:hypothetical protein